MNKTIYTQQSERLREALVKMRHKAGLTQRQLARKLGREHSLVSRLELGERRVDVAEYYWICRACGVDPSRAASALMREFVGMGRATRGDKVQGVKFPTGSSRENC